MGGGEMPPFPIAHQELGQMEELALRSWEESCPAFHQLQHSESSPDLSPGQHRGAGRDGVGVKEWILRV